MILTCLYEMSRRPAPSSGTMRDISNKKGKGREAFPFFESFVFYPIAELRAGSNRILRPKDPL